MERWSGKIAVITGASAGMGLETARVFVREGLIVVGLARRADVMQEGMADLEGPGTFHAKECDITKKEEVAATFEWIESELGTINILINSAGIMPSDTIEEADVEKLEMVMNVNVMGLLYCTKQAIKLMKGNNEEAQIININSVAGLKTLAIPGVGYNVYSASKFAVKSITDTLIHELRGSRIRCCNISPGATRTMIFENMKTNFAELEGLTPLETEDITNSILFVLECPPHVQISEITIKPFGQNL